MFVDAKQISTQSSVRFRPNEIFYDEDFKTTQPENFAILKMNIQ